MKRKRDSFPAEVLLWSIALPGFGQLLNGKLIKGVLFIFLEFLINMNSNLNLHIKYSFTGHFEKAVQVTDYQWALFYPCLYVFAMFDGYNDALKAKEQARSPLLALPFVCAAYLSTVFVIYQDAWLNIPVPPLIFPIIGIVAGFGVGGLVRKWVIRRMNLETSGDETGNRFS